jgi:murein DD-endopeptidase MepM/ murein hydrolase activator NlpD
VGGVGYWEKIMAHRRWTLLVVPEGSTESPRSFAFTGRALRTLATGAGVMSLIAIISLSSAITSYATPGGRAARADAQELGSELADLRHKMALLQDTIRAISERDEHVRMLAGLPSVDSAVREAGIGGPGTPEFDAGNALYKSNPTLGKLAFGARTDIDGLIRRANILSASFAEVSDTLSRNVQRLASTPSIMPTAGWLSSHFTRSRFHPILHISRPHEGIDVSAPMGAPVVAPASATVMRVARENGYGLVLELNHGNGIVTKFAHLSRVAVKEGQRVTRGQLVANVGNSGLSTGPHLHYEIHINGQVVDPLTYVLPGAIPD